jgi:hypothetical protein
LNKETIHLLLGCLQGGSGISGGEPRRFRYSAQFKNNCLAQMWSGSEDGSYLRLIDWFVFKAHILLTTSLWRWLKRESS